MRNMFEEFLIRWIRVVVCKLRFYYYVRFRNRLKTLESKDAIDHTVKHNLKSIGVFALTRMGIC